MVDALVQCDCCDHFSIPSDSDYEICPVCYWEQDAFGITEPDEQSAANHGLSLREGRASFLVLGACAAKFAILVAPQDQRASYRYVARAI
jgi:hypothetical protein